MKYSISICSNSRVRKMKFPGVISLRNDLPICAIPNGSFLRATVCTSGKSTNIPCAVSGRRYVTPESSSTGPMCVLNIMLNCLGSLNAVPPQFGQTGGSGRWSSRNRRWQLSHSTSGSWNPST